MQAKQIFRNCMKRYVNGTISDDGIMAKPDFYLGIIAPAKEALKRLGAVDTLILLKVWEVVCNDER